MEVEKKSSEFTLIYRSEELNPAEIEEIIFVNWIIDIKRKKGIRSCIRIALKNNEEFETLKSRIIEYGNYNNIRSKEGGSDTTMA